MPPIGVSIVVPVYNSQATISTLAGRVQTVMTATGQSFELILVDDASADGSWALIAGLSRTHERIRAIRLVRNFGQHAATLCGLRAAAGNIIVTLDDDLQNPPEEIPRLLAALAPDIDLIYGTPDQPAHGTFRNLASQLVKLALAQSVGARAARYSSSFRAFRAPLRDVFQSYSSPYVSIDVLLGWGTTRIAHVPVRHERRAAGESQYDFSRLLVHALTMLLSFTTLPLRLASVAGLAASLFGFGVLLFTVARYFLEGRGVPGFPFLASVIAILGGVQLFVLGIIGEYVARTHFRMLERPAYWVGEDFGSTVP